MAYDVGGFLSYLSGFGNSGSSSSSLSGFTGNSASSYGNQFFNDSAAWGSISPAVTGGKWTSSDAGADTPQLERLGSWGTGTGLGLVAVDALYGPATRAAVDLGGPTTHTLETYGISKEAMVDAASAAWTGAFVSSPGNAGASFADMREYAAMLGDIMNGKRAFDYNSLATTSNDFVNNLAGMDVTAITSVVDNFKSELRSRATNVDTSNMDSFDASLNSLSRDAQTRLTMVRNVAQSVVNRWGTDPNFNLNARAAGKFFTQFGISMDKGEQLLAAVDSVGIVSAPVVTQGEEGAPVAGRPTVTRTATLRMGTALREALKAHGINNPSQDLIEAGASELAGGVAKCRSDLESARSAILSPNADRGATGGEDDLRPRASQGVTPQDLIDYTNAVNAFGDLPVSFENGELRISDAYVRRIANMEKSDRSAQIGAISATARSAGTGLDLLGNYHDRVAGGHFTGEYRFVADSLLNSGNALRLAGEEPVTVGNTSVKMEEIRKAVASGASTAMVEDLNGNKILFDVEDFLASDAGAVAKLNDYIEMSRNYATVAPTTMAKLASAVEPGFLYSTNMLTGEKTMNGSNWLQLLLATGGIITPIATMLYQTEQERRNTRRNQEYADRVRAEDREFQERLLKLQLASAETQASIAADSKKAVATGSSRTGVSINSPTQSK